MSSESRLRKCERTVLHFLGNKLYGLSSLFLMSVFLKHCIEPGNCYCACVEAGNICFAAALLRVLNMNSKFSILAG